MMTTTTSMSTTAAVVFNMYTILALCVWFALAVTPVSARMRISSNSIKFGVEMPSNVAKAELTYAGDQTVTMNDGGTFNATTIQADSVAAASSLLVGGIPVLRHVRVEQTVMNHRPLQCCNGAADAVPGVEVTFTPVEGRVYMVSSTCRFTTEATLSESGPQPYIAMVLAIDGYVEGSTRHSFNWANTHVTDQAAAADYSTGRISGVAMASDLGATGVPHTYRLITYKAHANDLFAQYCDLSFTEFPFSPLL